MSRPLCPYGAKCYRKNAEHRSEYAHPDEDTADGTFASIATLFLYVLIRVATSKPLRRVTRAAIDQP